MCGICGCNQSGVEFKVFKPGENQLYDPAVSSDKLILAGIHHHHPHPKILVENEDPLDQNNHSRIIKIEKDILTENNAQAERNRGYLEAKEITAYNLVSSPGSGKTSLLERTLSEQDQGFNFYVIEGDQQTARDAERIAKTETPVIQINTGKACHLDARMIHTALKQFDLKSSGILFIENVGNLVCPSLFDLGESKRVVIISVTEGDDKAIKYPDMFHSSDLCIINKIDLLPYVNFDLDQAKKWALQVNHQLEFIALSATSGEGMENWYHWLKTQNP